MLDIDNLPCAVCGASADIGWEDNNDMDGKPLRMCSKSACHAFTSRSIEHEGRTIYLCSGHWEAHQLKVRVQELQAENFELKEKLKDGNLRNSR